MKTTFLSLLLAPLALHITAAYGYRGTILSDQQGVSSSGRAPSTAVKQGLSSDNRTPFIAIKPIMVGHIPREDMHTDRDEVLKTLRGWAGAWSEQNVQDYLGFYSQNFKAPSYAFDKWEQLRYMRISSRCHIQVNVHRPQVTVNGGKAVVKFRQHYVSDLLESDVDKMLVFAKQDGSWVITKERIHKKRRVVAASPTFSCAMPAINKHSTFNE